MHVRRIFIDREKFPTSEWYPFNLEAFRRLKSVEFPTAVTFFTGENGSGKSTLLKAMARSCGVHIWENGERTRYRTNRYENDLHRAVRPEWAEGIVPGSFFSSQLFQHFAEILDEWAHADPGMLEYFGGKSLLEQSHGQSLLSFFESRTSRRGLYLLDEPETALSPKNQVRLLRLLIRAAARGDAQFVAATHSPILLACPGAVIYCFDTVPARVLAYEETEQYRVTRDFLNQRERFIERLSPVPA
ncbi:MAG: AAA family ATPase [bacterium]|nr:AAA family ATPase [bacterium]